MPSCDHGPTSNFRCAEINSEDAHKFADSYYSNPDRNSQNAFLNKFAILSKKRRYQAQTSENDSHIPIVYKFPLKYGKLIKICQRAFLDLLNVPRCRIQQIVKMPKDPEIPQPSRRFVDRKGAEYEEKREAVINFCSMYQSSDETEYSEKPKIFLPCTVKQLTEVFNSQAGPNLQVLYGYFRSIVTANFEVVHVENGQDFQQDLPFGDTYYVNDDENEVAEYAYNQVEYQSNDMLQQVQVEMDDDVPQEIDLSESILGD